MDIDAYAFDPQGEDVDFDDEEDVVVSDGDSRSARLILQKFLPYECESLGTVDEFVEAVMRRIIDCIASNDFDVGICQWTQRLQAILALRYPLRRDVRAKLALLYYELSVMETLDIRLVELAASFCITLIRPKFEISRDDLELPWEPLHAALVREVYQKQRRVGHGGAGSVGGALLDLAEYAQRFFSPDAADAMLEAMLPRMDGHDINSVVVAQAFVVHFLPLDTPQRWLPALFRLWETFRTSLFDDQMLDHLARLAEYHMREAPHTAPWREIGIFSESEYARVMTKCLRSAGLPVGTNKAASATLMAQSASVRTGADAIATNKTLRLKKPSDILRSYATIMVFSMSDDGNEALVGRSRALDYLAKYMQATENYFHPSNWGIWQTQLASLMQHLTSEFTRRIRSEEHPECRTPMERRLTPTIRREFVSVVSKVCFLSMFGRDPMTILAAQSSLKRLAALQPELVIPQVLQRSYNSLEVLETTHRTTSVLSALAALAQPLVDRTLYPAGAKHLVPLLHLSLPGIDLNDPLKTISTSMFIMTACMSVYIDDVSMEPQGDISDEQVAVDGTTTSTLQEEDYAVRISTSEFEAWVSAFMRQVLHLVDTLPEEGKGGKIGEKHEEMILHTLLAACDVFCNALSPGMFDQALNILVEYVATTVSAAAVKVIGSLVACFARVDASKVLGRILRVCTSNIRTEIKHGASSVRTTSTSIPRPQDAALHYYINILGGALTGAGEAVLPYQTDVLDCITLLQEHCYSERSYLLSAQLVYRLLSGLLSIYPKDQRLVNKDVFESDEFRHQSQRFWGHKYAAQDVKIEWHTPSEQELDFALVLLEKALGGPLANVERLLDAPRDKVWHNEFCRNLCVLRFGFTALPVEHVGAAPGASLAQLSDAGGVSCSDFGIVDWDTMPAPMTIKIPDTRADISQSIKDLRERFGTLLVRATEMLGNGSEDQIDTLRLLVRSMRTYLMQHGFSADEYKKLSRSVSFFHSVGVLSPRQKLHPRVVWIKRAALYHAVRSRIRAQWRRRTALDDALIRSLATLALSDYVAVRKVAQVTLEPVCVHYDGARTVILREVLSSLAPNANEGQVKGALHVLGTKGFLRSTAQNASIVRQVVPVLLGVQHHAKPSIQKLVRSILHDTLLRLSEPSIKHAYFKSAALESAAAAARALVGGCDSHSDSPARRASLSDTEHTALLAIALAVAHAPTTHWAFLLVVIRLLHTETRRDKPIPAALASLFAKVSIADNPSLRHYAQKALVKALYLVKLRTQSESSRGLYLEQSAQPLRKRVKREESVTQEYCAAYEAQFTAAIGSESRLRDGGEDGWLMWSPFDDYATLPTEWMPWESESRAAVEAVRRVTNAEWWDRLADHLAHETERDYLSAESIQFLKSIVQVLGDSVLSFVQPLVERLVEERNRHKQRAAAELIAGLLRGSKNWPAEASERVVVWADSLLLRAITTSAPDSQPAWQMCVECVFRKRDPRRLRVILEHLIENAKSSLGGTQSALQQANTQVVLGSTVRALQHKFAPWGADEFAALYDRFLGHDYQEVRRAVSETLVDIDFSVLQPAFASVDELLASGSASGSLLCDKGSLSSRCASLSRRLKKLRESRVPVAVATSEYDRTAMATCLWISMSLDDHRAGPVSELAISFLPDLFNMLELRDNAEISALARSVLVKIVSYEHGAENANALLVSLLSITSGSENSWRVRLDVLPFLQIAYFENLFLLSDQTVESIIHAVLELLHDTQLEVREMAATTLSGIVRCSQRSLIASLRTRFVESAAKIRLPKRGTPGFDSALRSLHANILGAVALVDAFPYDVPDWMPELVLDTVAVHSDDPEPISSTVRRCAADFRRTHQDTWPEDQEKFGSRLQEVNDFSLGRCDYFV
ncbi:Proteasome activator BLM10 [Malassezia cuniculi]|uniref:Proteasome activator BLM10 n=1 Tax=Malassezia cuniculi TaxID=948313 RepID=A0AAF0ESF1_9BASI|nr:Proteasome activator BLM10 [Malassezia cuniculi]